MDRQRIKLEHWGIVPHQQQNQQGFQSADKDGQVGVMMICVGDLIGCDRGCVDRACDMVGEKEDAGL